MNPNTLAMVAVLFVVVVHMWVLLVVTRATRSTAEMAAVATVTNAVIAALVANRYDVDAAARDVLADSDHSAAAILRRREGANYDHWVRRLVERHAGMAMPKPK